jgi:hypothetical protein
MLLIALCATFFFQGIAEPGDVQRSLASILVGTSLMLALYVAEVPPRRLRLVGAVVGVVVLAVVAATIIGSGDNVGALVAIVNGLLIALAPAAVVAGLARTLRSTGTVTVSVVAGVLCLYLLFGMFFAFVYTAIQNIDSDPFFANGQAATSPRSVYFSFVSLATLGYGDYTARTNVGHTLSVSEALIGQIYLVTVVAAIVGRLVPRRSA